MHVVVSDSILGCAFIGKSSLPFKMKDRLCSAVIQEH